MCHTNSNSTTASTGSEDAYSRDIGHSCLRTHKPYANRVSESGYVAYRNMGVTPLLSVAISTSISVELNPRRAESEFTASHTANAANEKMNQASTPTGSLKRGMGVTSESGQRANLCPLDTATCW